MAEPKEIKQVIKEFNSDAIFIKGFDKAIIGTGRAIGGKIVAIYNTDDCLEILIDDHDMEELESWEHFNNVVNGDPGQDKPIFISDWRYAVSLDKIIEDIVQEKHQTLADILDQIKKEKENEEN
jgi:predicted transcriptional regulator